MHRVAVGPTGIPVVVSGFSRTDIANPRRWPDPHGLSTFMFQVLARKWRPQRFDDVVGQQAVTRTLRNAIASGRIAQAFVFGADRPHNTAVIVADMAAVQKWAAGLGIDKPPAELLEDSRTRALFRREIDAQSRDWKGYEQVRDFILDADAFTTDNDLLTPTFKLKRRNVTQKYQSKLDALYASNSRATAAVD